jgi:hypothetical protein
MANDFLKSNRLLPVLSFHPDERLDSRGRPRTQSGGSLPFPQSNSSQHSLAMPQQTQDARPTAFEDLPKHISYVPQGRGSGLQVRI